MQINSDILSVEFTNEDSWHYIPEGDEDGEFQDGEHVSIPVDISVLTIKFATGNTIVITGPIATHLSLKLRESFPNSES